MRTALCFLLLSSPALLSAQGFVGGVAFDSASGAPLRCVDVSVQDTAGRVFRRTQTAADGTFRLEAPAGPHQLEFAIWRHDPVKRTMLPVDGTSGGPPRYALTFEPTPPVPLILWPDTADSPPGPAREMVPLRNLGQLARRGEAAVAVARYVVDSTGRVDRSSIQVLESSNRVWERSVVDFLREVRYQPARRNGQPVCALEYGTPFTFNAHP
jgi:TonB family protein